MYFYVLSHLDFFSHKHDSTKNIYVTIHVECNALSNARQIFQEPTKISKPLHRITKSFFFQVYWSTSGQPSVLSSRLQTSPQAAQQEGSACQQLPGPDPFMNTRVFFV